MFCPHCGAALANGLEKCNCCGGTLKILYPQNQQQELFLSFTHTFFLKKIIISIWKTLV